MQKYKKIKYRVVALKNLCRSPENHIYCPSSRYYCKIPVATLWKLLYLLAMGFTSLCTVINLVSLFIFTASGAYHPAKRQMDLSFRDVCGSTGVDCKNGYCCYGGQECVENDPPLCRDLALRDWTMEAVDYSSFISLLDFDHLTTLGLTLSNIPKTLTFSTVLPTYSDNSIPPQYTPPTFYSDLVTATRTSTGGAVGPTVYKELFVGGIVGAGMAFL